MNTWYYFRHDQTKLSSISKTIFDQRLSSNIFNLINNIYCHQIVFKIFHVKYQSICNRLQLNITIFIFKAHELVYRNQMHSIFLFFVCYIQYNAIKVRIMVKSTKREHKKNKNMRYIYLTGIKILKRLLFNFARLHKDKFIFIMHEMNWINKMYININWMGIERYVIEIRNKVSSEWCKQFFFLLMFYLIIEIKIWLLRI